MDNIYIYIYRYRQKECLVRTVVAHSALVQGCLLLGGMALGLEEGKFVLFNDASRAH